MILASRMISGNWIKRYKRFMVDISDQLGNVITVHCPNTGSMKGCIEPGARVWCSDSENDKRKYRYTLEVIELQNRHLAFVNTIKVNQVVKEALKTGLIPEFAKYRCVIPEVKYGSAGSRIDFLLTEHAQGAPDCYLEVKNVTLLELGDNGRNYGCFPDAVSVRGQKHLRELMGVVVQGNRAVLLFCVSHTGIDSVQPADHIDPEYGRLLRLAIDCGVEVVAWKCSIGDDFVKLDHSVPVLCP